MPAIFAHDLFGRSVYRKLSDQKKALIREERDCFFLGLQGPDPLFFYRPVNKNRVRMKGTYIHMTPAVILFNEAIEKVRELKKSGNADKERALKAYLLGLTCHFALDSSLHDYINEQDRMTPYNHTTIETEFDRLLLTREGYRPLATKRGSHIKCTKKTCTALAQVLGVRSWTAAEAICSMKLIDWFFVNSDEWVKALIVRFLGSSKDSSLAGGMFMRKEPTEGCEEIISVMDMKFHEAIFTGVRLVDAVWDAIENGMELPKRFKKSFN